MVSCDLLGTTTIVIQIYPSKPPSYWDWKSDEFRLSQSGGVLVTITLGGWLIDLTWLARRSIESLCKPTRLFVGSARAIAIGKSVAPLIN